MRWLWRLLGGYVTIKIRGERLEGFLNRAAASGIELWDAERHGAGMLVASVAARDFARLRAVCRARGWRLSVADRWGLPFALRRLFRRKALLVGAGLAAAALYAATSFVWFVHVDAKPDLPVEAILRAASQAGLRPGVARSDVDRHEVQKTLLLEVDELSWAAVTVQGTRAVIHVAERVGVDPALSQPGDVVATRDGIIESVYAFAGSPVVEAGETVKAGSVLISGFIPPGNGLHERFLAEGKAPYVRADGIVKARVWYEAKATAQLMVVDEWPTGVQSTVLEIRIGERAWRWGKSLPNARASETEWEGNVGPIAFGWRRTRYEQVERAVSETSEQAARREALSAAWAQLEAMLPAEAVVASPLAEEARIVEGGATPVVEATVRVEVIEDIGGFRKIEF